jgi:hypothetical protein
MTRHIAHVNRTVLFLSGCGCVRSTMTRDGS